MNTNHKMYVAAMIAALVWESGCGGSKPAAEAGIPATTTPGGQPLTAADPGKASAMPEARPVVAVKPPPPPPAPIVIDAGTNLRVRSTTTLSTKTNAAGDAFHGSLDAPLTVDGKVIAARGARVQGVVASLDPGGRVKGVASLSVRLTSIETEKGPVSITTNAVARQARTTKRNDAVKVGIGSGIGAAIGAIAGGGRGAAIGAGAGAGAGTGVVLATRGEPAVLPAESVLTFRLTNAANVN